MPSHTYDFLMVGGSIMGCATAYYLLKHDPTLRVALVEMDPTYARASTPLSDGNTRIQFNIKENILMSRYGLEVLACFSEEMTVGDDKPDPAFRQQGNLFIIDEASREESLEGMALQQSLGCQVEWLAPAQVQAIYPLYNLEGCVGATFGPQDGTLSPLAVLLGYKNKIVAMGARFIHSEVARLVKDSQRLTGVQLANGETLTARAVLNSSGAWAAALARTAGVDLPVVPVKREVSILETGARPGRILPAIFFSGSLYCIHEGDGRFMAGKSLPDDPVTTTDFTWRKSRFEEVVWPALVEVMPSFDRLRVTGGWAGLYDVNALDGNAILGEWPTLPGLYCANGFSGHGFQQAHAVGRYLAELMLGLPPTLDLALFSPQRILDNAPVFESRRKII